MSARVPIYVQAEEPNNRHKNLLRRGWPDQDGSRHEGADRVGGLSGDLDRDRIVERRAINSKSDGHTEILELLATYYPLVAFNRIPPETCNMQLF